MTEYQVKTENAINGIFNELKNGVLVISCKDDLLKLQRCLIDLQFICNTYFAELRNEDVTKLPEVTTQYHGGGGVN